MSYLWLRYRDRWFMVRTGKVDRELAPARLRTMSRELRALWVLAVVATTPRMAGGDVGRAIVAGLFERHPPDVELDGEAAGPRITESLLRLPSIFVHFGIRFSSAFGSAGQIFPLIFAATGSSWPRPAKLPARFPARPPRRAAGSAASHANRVSAFARNGLMRPPICRNGGRWQTVHEVKHLGFDNWIRGAQQ